MRDKDESPGGDASGVPTGALDHSLGDEGPTDTPSPDSKQQASKPEPFASKKFRLLDKIAQDAKTPSTTFRVAYVICQHVNEKSDTAYPSQETIGREIGISARSVGTHVGKLKAAGYMTAESYRGPGQTSLYRMTWLPPDPKNSSYQDRKKSSDQKRGRPEANFRPANSLNGSSESPERKKRSILVGSKLPTEHFKEHISKPIKVVGALSRGTRWPDDAVVPDDWKDDALNARAEHGLPPDINIDLEAVTFANYWSAKTGAGATKADWRKTFINWTLKAKGTNHGIRQEKPSPHTQLFESVPRALAKLRRREGRE